MVDTRDVAAIAALLGDPTRSRMLELLMDGQAQTATELAMSGGVAPSTASSHLARMLESGLVSLTRQGRHRYYRIASADVARAIEGLTYIAPRRSEQLRRGPRDERLRRARVCYDHLAGEAGVRLLERMRGGRLIEGRDGAPALTAAGERWCARVGVDLGALRARRRPLCLPCLDWSERRMHLAGALGAALLDRLLRLRYARRDRGTRAVLLGARGEAFIERLEIGA